MADTTVLAGIFSVAVASVSGLLAFNTARSSAQKSLDGELTKVRAEMELQQTAQERARVAELRQLYLTPLRFYAHTLSHRLEELELNLRQDNDRVRGWFKTVKDQLTRDSTMDHYEAWCYYEGIFSVSTVYYTCCYFHCARQLRYRRPFAEPRPVYSEQLDDELTNVTRTFSEATGGGIWETSQELIGERFNLNDTKMTYAEMCEEHDAQDEGRRAPFYRLLDAYWALFTMEDLASIRSSLDRLVDFLDNHNPTDSEIRAVSKS